MGHEPRYAGSEWPILDAPAEDDCAHVHPLSDDAARLPAPAEGSSGAFAGDVFKAARWFSPVPMPKPTSGALPKRMVIARVGEIPPGHGYTADRRQAYGDPMTAAAMQWRMISMIGRLYDNACLQTRAVGMMLAAAGMLLTGAAAAADGVTALRIGLLMDLSSGSDEVLRDRQRAFELAIKHVNEGGGVFGLPVATAVGDTTADPEKAVAAARRLVESEGVHAIVGPNASAHALPIAERVIGPAGIPTVSFSATSPELTTVADRDFLFRTALSDMSQGPVLARVARERGFDNVGVIYVDDAWGRGLAGAFEAAWDGAVRAVPVDRSQTGFLTALRDSADHGAQALVVMAFESAALAMVREAIDNDLYDNFVFGDAAKRPSLVRTLGGDRLGDMYGTGPASDPASAAAAAWEASYIAEYGALPVLAFVKQTYDATIALALAAEAAGRPDGAGIRDRLRQIGSPPGTVVNAGPQGVAAALRILADGGEIDYEGVSGSMDWDANGDLRSGHIGIWRFTADERIEEVGSVAFERQVQN